MTLTIETPTHGRVLVEGAVNPSAVVLGFHGYTESAEIQMERLSSLPRAERWTLVSVQGLHRFYRRRSQDVCASWMTRQDRELAIRDNIEYVRRVISKLVPPDLPYACVGFSQGVAMAFRAATRTERTAACVVAVGGDVPPELLDDPGVRFGRVLLCRGRQDQWYTEHKLTGDLAALRSRGADVQSLVYEGGHEWTPEVAAAVADVLP